MDNKTKPKKTKGSKIFGKCFYLGTKIELIVIKVGNIPYELNQNDLEELFSCVGPIVGPFKYDNIVYYRLISLYSKSLNMKKNETKHSGYGFCRYTDCDTAQAAIRNLNGYEIKGFLNLWYFIMP